MEGLGPGKEFDLIRRFLPHAPRFGRSDVRVGPGDDCAVVAGEGIAVSADMSVEGVHFRRDWLDAHQIGCRAASAALSDLAAVAARPIGVLASLAVPEEPGADDFAVGVMDGVRSAAERLGAVVLGGDLTRSTGPVVLDVMVLGDCPRPVLRSGAEPGDEVWVTGELGAAAVTIARLLRGEEPHPAAWDRFACPLPRVPEARWLEERGVLHAMIDLSDGLAGDASHIASASRVAVVLDAAAIPIHPAVVAECADAADALRYALAGGEDYELCFTAPAGTIEPLRAEFEADFGVVLTRVGRIEPGEGVWWADGEAGRRPLGMHGYQHFEDAP
jgi:thiamine-monophosphate kinase